MSQYRVGTVDVTNGSATVAGNGTQWAVEIQPGDTFVVSGDPVSYTVASVADDTTLQLSAPYQCTSENCSGSPLGQSNVTYSITRDFTTRVGAPKIAAGDINTATLLSKALDQIDAALYYVGSPEQIVFLAGDQTIDGTKTFTEIPYVNSNRILTESDFFGSPTILGSPSTTFVLTTGNQTIGGTKTFENTLYINSDRVLTESDFFGSPTSLGSPVPFVLTSGAQTIDGTKTFTSSLFVNANRVLTEADFGSPIGSGTGGGSVAPGDGLQAGAGSPSTLEVDSSVVRTSLTLSAGSGLTGGGDLSTNRTFNVGEGTGITVAADAISTNDSEIVHDNLSGFVANEHISHSSVTLTAGDGLTGGGDITSSRSFAVDSSVVRTSGNFTMGGNVILNKSSTSLEVPLVVRNLNDGGGAELRVIGNGQGDGYIFVGQSSSFGGGIAYRGDGTSPKAMTGGTTDDVIFFTRSGDVDSAVFHCDYNGTVVNFVSTPTAGGNTIWHAGNDGSGSGLDADTCDGLHVHSGVNNQANQIVRTDGNGYCQFGWINTTSGSTSGTPSRIYASGDGYIRYYTAAGFRDGMSGYLVGINNTQTISGAKTYTAQPAMRYGISGDYTQAGGGGAFGATIWSIDSGYQGGSAGSNSSSSSVYGIRWLRSSHTNANANVGEGLYSMQNGSVNSGMGSAGIYTTGDVTAASDLRLKSNIERIPYALEKIAQISGYTFTRVDHADKQRRRSGVIAQEVEKVLPEVVTTDDSTGLKSVAYGNLTALLIEAIKELEGRVAELEAA